MLTSPQTLLRRALVSQVRSVFNDQARGEKPVVRSARALYPANSVISRVHADIVPMMIGGVSALLLQMLHPVALAGIWDHSNFRHDMLGRLRRTARFIAETTYAEAAQAEAAIARVIDVHSHVKGILPDGRPYCANDPDLLAWVHVAEAVSFLAAWKRYGEPGMSMTDQNTYFREAAKIAIALGAEPVPQDSSEARQILEMFRPQLNVTETTRKVAAMVLYQPAPSRGAALPQDIIMQAAIDLLPDWAKAMHGFPQHSLRRSSARFGAQGLATLMAWAFKDIRRDIAP